MIHRAGLTRAGVEIHDQRATLDGHHRVRLADGTTKTARHILIAAGGRPAPIGIPGEELAMISDDLFLMDRLLRRIPLVGGGFYSLRIPRRSWRAWGGHGAGLSRRRGAAGFDREARDLATLQLSAVGVDLRLGLTPAALERDGDGIRVRFDDGSDDRFGTPC